MDKLILVAKCSAKYAFIGVVVAELLSRLNRQLELRFKVRHVGVSASEADFEIESSTNSTFELRSNATSKAFSNSSQTPNSNQILNRNSNSNQNCLSKPCSESSVKWSDSAKEDVFSKNDIDQIASGTRQLESRQDTSSQLSNGTASLVYKFQNRQAINKVIFFPEKQLFCRALNRRDCINEPWCGSGRCGMGHSEQSSLRQILQIIYTAKDSIDLAIFCFTSEYLFDALSEMSNYVKIRIVLHNDEDEGFIRSKVSSGPLMQPNLVFRILLSSLVFKSCFLNLVFKSCFRVLFSILHLFFVFIFGFHFCFIFVSKSCFESTFQESKRTKQFRARARIPWAASLPTPLEAL